MNTPADTLAALAPCPFDCGDTPRISSREASDSDGRGAFVAFVTCYCGGYSACAHKMGFGDSDAGARASAIAAWNRRASLKGEAEPRKPDGYAYRYPHHDGDTVIRFTCGQEINGARPIEAVPYFYGTPPAPQAVGENAGDIPDIGELTPERIEYLAGAVNAAWCKSDMMVRAKRCQQAAQALRMLAAKLHPTPSPSPQGASYEDFVRLATDPNRKPAPQGGGEAAMERWHSAINDASELFSNAPDQRFASRASRVVTYLKATPPAQQPGECAHANDVLAEDGVRFCNVCGAPKEKGNG